MRKIIIIFCFLVFVLSCSGANINFKDILDDFKPGTFELDYNYLIDPSWSYKMCLREELKELCISGKAKDESELFDNLKIEYDQLNLSLNKDKIIE